jgi:hypothetical protein
LVGTPVATEKTRANYIGVGVAGTSAATAAAATQVNSFIKFTAPTTAGTYPMTIQHSVLGTFLTGTGEDRPFADIAFTLTVKAASGLSTALSTAYIMGAAEGANGGTPTTNVVAYSAVKTAGTKIAQIEVTLKNADGSAAAGLHTVAASVTGSGFVTVDNTPDTAPGAARASSLAANAAGRAYVHIAADGNAGVGTITVTVTDSATFATTTLGTYKVTSYGSVTKLTATAIYTVARAGGFTTGDAASLRDEADIIPAVIIEATDSLGNIVSGLTISALSSNTNSVNSAITIAEDDPTGDFSSGGLGFYNASFSTTSAAKSGDVATLTFRIANPAAPTTFLTADVAITVGGAVATETLSLDKTSYAPGEAMVITRTAKDSAGNPVHDGALSPIVTFNKAVGGTPPGAGAYVGGVSATSATKPSVFAPVTGGEFLARMTSGNTAKSLVTATATIAADTTATDISQAAADAAAEATDAANAATDAANAAAEAADAATAAAQDAADAVAALSTQVAELIGDLRKQITSLTNLVIKIQKKVKA